jgi:thiol-disulfide isomerase/thioredoxin
MTNVMFFRRSTLWALTVIVAMLVVLSPAQAQDGQTTKRIDGLAQSLFRDNDRFGNVTYWVGGNIGVTDSEYTELAAGDPIPAFEFDHMESGDVLDSGTLEGVYVLNFWASWCPPCRAEFPRLLRDIESLPFPVYFINVYDRSRDAASFLQNHDEATGIYVDVQNRFSERHGLGVIPQTYLIDADGNIQAIHVGELTETALKFLVAIAENPGVGSFED